MRIKIVGENDCARATRHLLRKAGFAVTEFLPAEAVTHGPHAGYLITIELAPATPDLPASEPGSPQQSLLADSSKEASVAQGGTDASSAARPGAAGSGGPPAIRFDSVEGALEAAVLRHVTQLSASPVVVDRPGGVVHSERELRVVIPRLLAADKDVPRLLAADKDIPEADPAAAVAVEFGVLRGLLDLLQPAPGGPQPPAPPPAPRHWWKLFAAVLALAGSVRAAPPSPVPAAAPAGVELRGTAEDGSFLALSVAPGALFPQLQGATGQIFSSVYDAGNTALKVNCVVGCSATSGFSDNGTFTAGATSVNNISAVFNDSIPALTSGNAGAVRATSDRMLYVNIGKLGGAALSGANVVDGGNTAFRVNCVVGCSASAGFTDNSAFSAGAMAESNIGGVYNDSLAGVTSGNAAAARITANRALHVNLRNASGNEVGTSGAPVRVDPTGTTAQPVSGTVTANAGAGTFTVGQATGTNLHMVCDSGCGGASSFADNAAFTAGTTPISITGGWYSTSPTNCASGNACAPQLSQDRKLFVQDFQGTNPWVVSNGGTFAVQAAQSGTWNIGSLTSITNALPSGTNVIGHVIADSGSTTAVTGNVTVVQGAGTNLHAVMDSGSTTAVTQSSGSNLHVNVDSAPTTAVTQSGTWTVQPGNTQNTTAWLVRRNDGSNSELLDPCQTAAKSSKAINQTATAVVVSGTSSKKTYVCSMFIVSATAQNLNWVEGTGTTCGTSTAGVTGGTTAATGPNLAANEGWTLGNGAAFVAASATNADDLCLQQSGTGQVSGVITYAQQ
jgi:hypothetical protein